MSRRIRRGRRGIDLPLKNSPTSTDRLIGHDASGVMFQATINELLRQSFSVRVASTGTAVANIPGRVALSVTRPSTGTYVLTNAAGLAFFAAAATPIGSTQAVARLQGTNTSTLTVTWAALGSGAAVNVDFALVGELA